LQYDYLLEMILSKAFYQSEDVVNIARNLLGKTILTQWNGQETSGIICETEAYKGAEDKASHAWNNRRTQRTETMFEAGGIAYVYLCYGIHHLFNVVTGPEDVPHAVLIRAIQPVRGIEHMLLRRNMSVVRSNLCAGPGTLSKALGIEKKHNGLDLQKSKIQILDTGIEIPENEIQCNTRIGVEYAGADALYPWRFNAHFK